MDMEKELVRGPNTVSPPSAQSEPEGGKARVSGKSSGVRHASDEQFKKAHRKTSAQHAGLFRRLAK